MATLSIQLQKHRRAPKVDVTATVPDNKPMPQIYVLDGLAYVFMEKLPDGRSAYMGVATYDVNAGAYGDPLAP